MPRPPMGHATPITNPAVLQNPLRQQWKGGPKKGWIPPQRPTVPFAPAMPLNVSNVSNVPKAGPGPAQMSIPQMVPIYGFAPLSTGPQPSMGHCQSMATPIQQQAQSQEKAGKDRRRRKRHEDKEYTTSSDSSSGPSRKRKRTHTVWLSVGGKRVPAKYRA